MIVFTLQSSATLRQFLTLYCLNFLENLVFQGSRDNYWPRDLCSLVTEKKSKLCDFSLQQNNTSYSTVTHDVLLISSTMSAVV